jgi:hypothetical protein
LRPLGLHQCHCLGASHDSTGNPIIFGTTSTGKRIAVIFIDDSADDLVVIYPETAYPVPEYGD